ncbi:hypothetical protein I862_07395 [endosymbiont of Acanthamoeba sp. UWC8]|uniref:hypothetical protein n=1 Tax=endosymbiont of Acanthamoeba sp. UWC8 TaxID=86106 RepID=UPI0004D1CC8A|nr:hypothetical protein [endosymbiont of Acanthamoeba sp. UWC8]AIF82033.1 hypothetical protein I862_07395 [endosymbiont of Acanthamoeba sp. UWC8]
MTWNDFNSAEEQGTFNLIPQGTIAKVKMIIRPGGYDDLEQGWTGGYATQNDVTGSVYLNCEYIILEGEYAHRKVWGLIGLYSPKGTAWANRGRVFIKAMLNSAYNLHPQDISPSAQAKRHIKGLSDLDGIEFLAQIEINKDRNGESKNEIRLAITPDHKDYASYMNNISGNRTERGW